MVLSLDKSIWVVMDGCMFCMIVSSQFAFEVEQLLKWSFMKIEHLCTGQCKPQLLPPHSRDLISFDLQIS